MSDELLLKELRFRCENSLDEWPAVAGERIEELLARVKKLEASLREIIAYSRQPNSMCVERWDLEVECREMRAIAKRALGILDKPLR